MTTFQVLAWCLRRNQKSSKGIVAALHPAVAVFLLSVLCIPSLSADSGRAGLGIVTGERQEASENRGAGGGGEAVGVRKEEYLKKLSESVRGEIQQYVRPQMTEPGRRSRLRQIKEALDEPVRPQGPSQPLPPKRLQFEGRLGRQFQNSSAAPEIFQDTSFSQGASSTASSGDSGSSASAPCPLESN